MPQISSTNLSRYSVKAKKAKRWEDRLTDCGVRLKKSKKERLSVHDFSSSKRLVMLSPRNYLSVFLYSSDIL
jgi:hypothetical protein